MPYYLCNYLAIDSRPPPPFPALTPCFCMAVNWGIIYFYFVSFTAGMTIPTSVHGMFCLGEKKQKNKKKKKQEIEIIKVQNCSTN